MITYQTLEINNNDLDVFRNYIQQNEKAECNFTEFVEFLNNLKKY